MNFHTNPNDIDGVTMILVRNNRISLFQSGLVRNNNEK